MRKTDLFLLPGKFEPFAQQNSNENLYSTFLESFEKDWKINNENLEQNSEKLFTNGSESNEDFSADKSEQKVRRTGKGLKQLSVLVRDTVIEKKSLSYKEVAELILNDTSKRQSLNLPCGKDTGKEDLNIKRWVYDALNVLIAAEILLKDGKQVKPFAKGSS